MTACRLAGSPTSVSPLSVKATTDGVSRLPSWLAMTVDVAPFHDRDHAVGRPQVDADDLFTFRHDQSPFPTIERWRGCGPRDPRDLSATAHSRDRPRALAAPSVARHPILRRPRVTESHYARPVPSARFIRSESPISRCIARTYVANERSLRSRRRRPGCQNDSRSDARSEDALPIWQNLGDAAARSQATRGSIRLL